MNGKEELFLYNDDVNGNKIVLLYNDDDEDEQIEVYEEEEEVPETQYKQAFHSNTQKLAKQGPSTASFGRKLNGASLRRDMTNSRPATGSLRRNLGQHNRVFSKRSANMQNTNIMVSRRLKNSNKKKSKEYFNRKMVMTQSSPFISSNMMKGSSPDRSDGGGGYNTRVAQSRVSRYNFNKSEVATYNAFVDLICMFDKQSMADILEDVLKDAEDKKTMKQFYHE